MGRQAKPGCLVLVWALALTCCWATAPNGEFLPASSGRGLTFSRVQNSLYRSKCEMLRVALLPCVAACMNAVV